MRRYRASWVLPIVERPIRDGWVDIDRGRIAAVGRSTPEERAASRDELGRHDIDLGSAAILPGLVNAHTHLELSALRGQVAPADAMPTWVEELLMRRDEIGSQAVDAIPSAIEEARRTGTVLIGDVSNSLAPVDPLIHSSLAAVVFREIIGFNPADARRLVREVSEAVFALRGSDRVRLTLAAHAPYSVAPAVFEAIRDELDRRPGAPLSVHLAESRDEIEFLQAGTGRWRALLDRVGAWNPHWSPPGGSPVSFLEKVGWLDPRVIVVHGVQLDAAELDTLVRHEMTLVTCPRSNEWTGAGEAPVARFVESGVRLAVGTDSLASAPDLNLFEELAAMRRLAPNLASAAILESATRHGARALGFADQYGTIELGKRGELIAVAIPDSVEDVEEYLVRGVDASRVQWIGERPDA